MRPKLEECQHWQIELQLTGGNEGVPAKTERTSGRRKCATAVCVEASQRINWPAAPNYQNRSDLNVAGNLRDNSRRGLGLLFVSERKVKSPAQHEPMPLSVGS